MKKTLLVFLLLILALIPVALVTMQDAPSPRLEIAGVNPTDLPAIVVTANVYDTLGQPVGGLTADNFEVVGPLAGVAQIVSVRQIEDANLPVAVVLVIDVSTSMEGRPFEQAKESARVFVNAIGPNDPVAIVAFSSRARLIQDYTSDKNVLLAAIDALPLGGETSLYEGAFVGVQKAGEAPTPRRAVILLSDGAQYDTSGPARAARGDAYAAAQISGVPVYTIGLGFGIDRTYLTELATNTNGRNFESPAPEQLEQIYRELAALLRSQYEIVLSAELATDGTEYDLQLQVTTDQGTAFGSAGLRAPIPVPIITLPALDSAISEPTEITADIAADDAITAVDVSLDNQAVTSLSSEPYTFLIEPFTLTPGQHALTFTATDDDGESSTAALNFEVAPLPSVIEFVTEIPEGEISEVTRFGLSITGQTPAANVNIQLDGGELGTLTAPDYSFTINPFNLTPGEHALSITVLNEAGVTTTLDRTFRVADLPPTFEVSGLAEGQTLNEPTTVQATVLSTQSQINNIAFELNGTVVDEIQSGVISLDPLNLPSGAATLTILVENEADQSATQTINFEIAALPPQITFAGLELGEALEENREVTVETSSQTPVAGITFLLDGEAVEGDGNTLSLDVLSIAPGPHILSVEVTTENGQSASADLPFIISEGPSLTQTALFTPSATPTVTPSSTPTPDAAQTSTAEARVTNIALTADARQNAIAQAAQSVLTATSEFLQVQATENAPITETARVEQATASAEAEQQQMTATRQAENDMATVSVQLTEAGAALEETAIAMTTATVQTAEALITATEQAAISQVTLVARETILAGNAQSTVDARQTELAQSSRDILTQTREAANSAATANAEATASAQTEEAVETETPEITSEATEVAVQSAEVSATPTVETSETGDETPSSVTITPIGTLIPQQAETTPQTTSILPIAIIVVIVVLILIIVFVILSRARRRG